LLNIVLVLQQLTGAVLEKNETAKLEELFSTVKQKIADDESSA